MSSSLLMRFRLWHRKLAPALFLFFITISITGILLGWKSMFNTMVFENKSIKPNLNRQTWLPLDALAKKATEVLTEKTKETFIEPERIELRPAKGSINFMFKKNYFVQLDGATGSCIQIEQKNGSLIQDIHDGAIFGNLFANDMGWSKKVYSTFLGLAFLAMIITGFYLWYKPRQLNLQKNKNEK